MAFAYTVDTQSNIGKTRIVTGTWTSTLTTATGEIDTGLATIFYANASTYGAAVATDEAAFNETFPFINGQITLICTSGTTGGWEAVGL